MIRKIREIRGLSSIFQAENFLLYRKVNHRNLVLPLEMNGQHLVCSHIQ
jgi:hypothetical protein